MGSASPVRDAMSSQKPQRPSRAVQPDGALEPTKSFVTTVSPLRVRRQSASPVRDVMSPQRPQRAVQPDGVLEPTRKIMTTLSPLRTRQQSASPVRAWMSHQEAQRPTASHMIPMYAHAGHEQGRSSSPVRVVVPSTAFPGPLDTRFLLPSTASATLSLNSSPVTSSRYLLPTRAKDNSQGPRTKVCAR